MPALVNITGWEITRERKNGVPGAVSRIFVRTMVQEEGKPETAHPEEFDINSNLLKEFGATDGERSPKLLAHIQEQADIRHYNWQEAQNNSPLVVNVHPEEVAGALGLKSPTIRIDKTFRDRGEKPKPPPMPAGLEGGPGGGPKRSAPRTVSPLGTVLDQPEAAAEPQPQPAQPEPVVTTPNQNTAGGNAKGGKNA